MKKTSFRIEKDLLGEIRVPALALHGAQTERAIRNFPLNGVKPLSAYPELVEALMVIKQAAAAANRRNGFLDARRAQAIRRAADAILRNKRFDLFPIHSRHGGGGTSANMNANEVLANLAEERLGGRRGDYRKIHPNDHVNLHQSTNDVYPTACHLAVIARWPLLAKALTDLETDLTKQAARWKREPRLARTCLQDAVETSFGDLFGGYAGFVGRAQRRIAATVDALHAVNLGGTIVGRSIDVPPRYLRSILPELRRVTGNARLRAAPDRFDSAQNLDELVAVSSALDLLARGLIKIAQDFRLLGSGPEAGLGELRLPAVQPGSSIMPGKVNPVIPEFLMQLGFEACGCHTTCLMALDHGELDLNVWESSATCAILDAMALLANGVTAFRVSCLKGVRPDAGMNRRHVQSLIPLLTRLTHEHGYSTVSRWCREAGGEAIKIRERLKAEGL